MNQEPKLQSVEIINDIHAGAEVSNKKGTSLKDVAYLTRESREKAGLIYDYDDKGEIVRLDGLPLTRKERRIFKQQAERRVKKLEKLKAKVEWEKIKLERAEEAKKIREASSSN